MACAAFAAQVASQANQYVWQAWRATRRSVSQVMARAVKSGMVKYRLFQLAALIVPRLPYWLARRLFWWVGMAGWALAPAARRRATFNLNHVIGDDPLRLRWATRQAFGHVALNYLDFLRGARLSDAQVIAGWEIENETLLHETMRLGRGMIVLTGHFGAWELAMSRLGVMGYPMLTPAERLKPEALFSLFLRLRNHHHARLLPGDSRETLRELLGALRRNEIVVFAVDRYVLGQSVYAPFFGVPARLPTAPTLFALRNEAPTMLLGAWREPGGRTHGYVQRLDLHGAVAAYDAEQATTQTDHSASASREARQRQRDGRLLAAQQVVTAALEDVIARRPEQWVSVLSPIWDAPDRGDRGDVDASSAALERIPYEAP